MHIQAGTSQALFHTWSRLKKDILDQYSLGPREQEDLRDSPHWWKCLSAPPYIWLGERRQINTL
jgi:hypothetical protein